MSSKVFLAQRLRGTVPAWAQDTVGGFEVGKEFEALLVETGGGAAFDVFAGDSLEDRFQKFVTLGDDRSIRAVWVQGRLVLWK